MTDTEYIESQVKGCIIEMFLTEAEAESLHNDTDLLAVLDSLRVLRLVIELESRFAVKVHDSDLSPDTLGRVAKVAAFIRRKRAEAGGRLGEPLAQGR